MATYETKPGIVLRMKSRLQGEDISDILLKVVMQDVCLKLVKNLDKSYQ